MKCQACKYDNDIEHINGISQEACDDIRRGYPEFYRLPIYLTHPVRNLITKNGNHLDQFTLYVCPNCGTTKMDLGILK